mmetsp:Transcript_39062/g.75759  ORF Transcript_39062/g.75759 Transcript_39062/m.75759 type:complete len:416 (+) Transcript_39062:73-1320(+)
MGDEQKATPSRVTGSTFFRLFNGDLHVSNDSGEANQGNAQNYVTIPGKPTDDSKVIFKEKVICKLAEQVHDQKPLASNREKNLVLAIRSAAWRMGLLIPKGKENDYKKGTRYNECKEMSQANTDACYETKEELKRLHELKGDGAAAAITAAVSAGIAENKYDWLDEDLQSRIEDQATNILCLIAYVFRARGHHYTEDIKGVYADKWEKNRNADNDLIKESDWQIIATRGAHAILPTKLDEFYLASAAENKCCRAYMIRVNVPCAGTAFYFALLAGLDEVRLIYGKHLGKFEGDIKKLKDICDDLSTKRWKGGINRIYYGGEAYNGKESTFAALAAVVFGTNSAEEVESELKNAKSLERVAKNAPLAMAAYRAYASGFYNMLQTSEGQAYLGEGAVKTVFGQRDETREIGDAKNNT